MANLDLLRRKWLFFVQLAAGIAAMSIVAPAISHAGATAASWVVVVNGESQNSRTIANYYVKFRNIPPRNVIVLKDIPEGETMTELQFKEIVLQPVLKAIDDRQLTAHVQGIAYSCDIPTRINVTPAKDVPQAQAVLFSPIASLNSSTYLYQGILADRTIVSLFNNFYCRVPVEQTLQIPMTPQLKQEVIAENQAEGGSGSESDDTLKNDKPKADTSKSPVRLSRRFLEKYLKEYPFQNVAWFQLAVTCAEEGDKDAAIDSVSKAIATGWNYRKLLKEHPGLKSLQSDTRFETLLIACEDAPTDWTEPRGFDARLSLTQNGVETPNQNAGMRYMMSTVLAATQKVGNTMEDAIEALRISSTADFTQPKGTFYYTSTPDPRSTCREPLFNIAIEKLKKAGFQAEKITTTFPVQKKDVVGVTMGAASFSWIASGSKMLPGAIADNLTSLNGAMQAVGQTKLTEFLAHGAAGASGAVNEPYSLQNKFPLPMIHESYARGATLAEAFYQNLMGPYQLLIVGDPLCQPWAKPPEVKVTGHDPNANVTDRLDLAIESTASEGLGEPVSMMILVDGAVKAVGKTRVSMRLDTKPQNLQGYEEMRIIAQDSARTRTRREEIIELHFGTPEQQLNLIVPDKVSEGMAKQLELRIDRPRDTDVTIVQNAEIWTTIKAGETSATFDASKAGKGPVRVQAIAQSGNRSVKSKPMWITLE